jgi:DNA-binding SARP family transcriptional activator/tetratricopeptide (TPR) repeat protein
VEFRVLGPLEIYARGRPAPLTSGRQRKLLAVLLCNAGRTVPLHTLVSAVWDEQPPATAKRQVQNSMSALRRLLEVAAGGSTAADRPTIVAEHEGYRLHLATATLDADVFAEHVDAARQLRLAGQHERAATELRAALDLWRGGALAGLTGPVIESAATRLDERRRAATQDWVDVEMDLGRHADLIGELTQLVAGDPYQERFVGQLMLALHRCGRQSDALAAYRRFRDRLADELGLEPGARLQRLHADILGDEAGLDPPDAAAPAPTRVAVVPAQLPADIAAFAGRTTELNELDKLLNPHGPVTICAITGTAGVGKTTLAVHWGHQIRQYFPDGQLYVNLRGFDPAGPPLDPGDVLRSLLDAFGTPPERIPVDLPGRSALYRSLLANRRVLVVLDNARDAGQVRWLLPGSPTCLVVVTSRSLLPGLVAAEGAHPVVLDLLSPAEAGQLLAARLGRERIAAEPEAVDEIIARCARLPLAIAVAAARAATHPGFQLATIASELRAARGCLDALAGTDPATDLRAVSSWSYQELSAPAKRLFRLIGLHPGPDVTVAAAASLTAAPEHRARSALAELREASLVTEHTPGRYACHDLLRAYATELVGRTEPAAERRAALRRLLDHYLHTAYAADRMLDRFRDPIETMAPSPGTVVAEVADHERAMGWFATELAGLLAAIDRAAADRFDGHAWRLAWALAYFMERRGHWQPWAAAHRTALAAARRLGDPTGQAHALRSLGRVHVHLGHPDEAVSHLGQAHDLFRDAGDLAGHARIHFDLCWIATRLGTPRRALDHAEQALELFQATENRSGQARALNNVAWGHSELGNHAEALAFGERALALNRATGDRYGEADSWDALGQSHLALRHVAESVHCHQCAVALYRELGHRWGEADSLVRLGEAYQTAGNRQAAAEAWRRAAAILDDLGHPDADRVRAKL